jgi:hypothetical protein
MRQWHAPTRGSCALATEIVTAPHRQWPLIEAVEAPWCGALADSTGLEDMAQLLTVAAAARSCFADGA